MGRTARYEPAQYDAVFGSTVSPRSAELIEKRIHMPHAARDPLDDLLGAAPAHVVEWMRHKALLADGTTIGIPVCTPEDVADVLRSAREEDGVWQVRTGRQESDAWLLAHVGLLRELCAATLAEVALLTQTSASGAWARFDRHRARMQDDAEYAHRLGVLASRALAACHRGVIGPEK